MKGDESATAAPPSPPLPQRRPRVREVSSRFMSPLVSSNVTATPTPNIFEAQHRSKSANRRRHHDDKEEPENIRPPPPTTIRRSLDTPLFSASVMSSRKQNQQSQRAKQQLFKENVGVEKGAEELQRQWQISDVSQSKSSATVLRSSSTRPDTPTVMGTDRIVPSRYRQMSQSSHRSIGGPITPAAKLLQEATSSCSDDTAIVQKKLPKIVTSGEAESHQQQPRSCPNSPICFYSSKSPVVADTRSSMLESSFLNNCESSKLACSRSLDLHSSKVGAVLPLPPPHPMSSKLGGGADARRGRKLPNHQEDLYSLKLLHNHHLQWRYANAKAEASMQSQKKEAEGKLYALGSKIADLHAVVQRKRIELETLRRITTISTILERNMPYLDEWSGVEEDYSTSLTGMIGALVNTSLRLPVSGEVRADVRELGEVLNSAKMVMEMIALHIQSFMPKAEELDNLISELAWVSGRERGLIEECGDLIFKTHASQVNEWSLRAHLVQLDSGKPCQSQQE